MAAFFVGLLFSFVNDHLDEPVEMLSFPPCIFGSRVLALFAATCVIVACVRQLNTIFVFLFNFLSL